MSDRPPVAKAGQQAAASLRTSITGDVLLPDDADYGRAISMWNCNIATQPAVVVLPRSAADVQLAVKTAVSFHLPLSVRGYGREMFGRALCDGMVLSMEHMREVKVDTASETVTFGGGLHHRRGVQGCGRSVACHRYRHCG